MGQVNSERGQINPRKCSENNKNIVLGSVAFRILFLDLKLEEIHL